MRKTSVLLAALPVLAWAQTRPGVFQSGGASLSGNGVGYSFRYETAVEPKPAHMSDLKLSGGVKIDHATVHRQLKDEAHSQYLGYDLTAVAGPGPNQYTVTISPLTVPVAGMSAVPLPKYPAPLVVSEGETIELPLLVSADEKQRVVDYLEVGGLSGRMISGVSTSAAGSSGRDYTPDDGQFHLNPSALIVTINGNIIRRPEVSIKPGATVWVTDPHLGRLILSLTPHEGFRRGGSVHDNIIDLDYGHMKMEIRAIEPILDSSGVRNLYVLHQPQFPPSKQTSIGVDRLENLLNKR